MSGAFSKSRDGVAFALPEPETDVLRQVVAEIRAVVQAEERPDFARRLFPPAYPDDQEAQAEYAGLMTEDLVREKVAALTAVDASLSRGRVKRGRWTVKLSAEESHAWLGVINDARLTIGTKLEVSEQDYERPIDPADPDAHARAVYHWLGWLQESLVETLMA